ncbi:MAG: serine/threonine-protein phosphatase [Candidatus Cloacimonetes bacterium]|nr:serine/threonine-protein phosphatase [Candidatus Cloacimonadota bacterium]
MLEIACYINIGKRPYNDDRVLINDKLVSEGTYTETTESCCLVAVCDGVGGADFGFEAAEITLNTFVSHSTDFQSAESTADFQSADIENIISQANNAVIKAQRKDAQHSKMATTIAGLYINNNDFIAFNIGDTRIYRFRSPYIMQLSTDHVNEEQKNALTRFIGGNRAIPNIVDGKDRVFENDIYVLCSDGVWGTLKNEDFENIIINNDKLEIMCESLVELALEKRSTDNMSIIIVKRR